MSSLDVSVEWYIENIYNQFFGRVALMRCLVSSEYLQKTDRSCDWAIKEFSAHLGKGGFSAFCLEGVFSWQDSSAERGRKRGGIWQLWALQWAMHMIPQISVSQWWSLRENSWNTSLHIVARSSKVCFCICICINILFCILYLYQYFVGESDCCSLERVGDQLPVEDKPQLRENPPQEQTIVPVCQMRYKNTNSGTPPQGASFLQLFENPQRWRWYERGKNICSSKHQNKCILG